MDGSTKIHPDGLTEWLASGTTGASAMAIVSRLTGHGKQRGDYPHDGGDFGRCERLLGMVPSLRPDLHLMADVNAYWAALIPAWDEIKASKDQYTKIKSILSLIEAADPGHIQMGEGVSMRFGDNIGFSGESTRPPMKETEADREVNHKAQTVAAAELRQFVERIERLRAEQAEIKALEKEVFAELKSRGFMSRPVRTLIKERAMDPDKRAEDEAVLEMYKSALGMG